MFGIILKFEVQGNIFSYGLNNNNNNNNNKGLPST